MEISHERKALDKLKSERERLAAVARAAQLQAEQAREQAAYLLTPAGAASKNDDEIEKIFSRARSLEREHARTVDALNKFDAGDGHNLAVRLEDLTRREEQSRYAEARGILERALHDHLAKLREVAESEWKLDALALSAGYRRGPIKLIAGEGNLRSDFDRWRYDAFSMCSDLLDATDPQRILYEREHPPVRTPEQLAEDAETRRKEDKRIAHTGGAVPMRARTVD